MGDARQKSPISWDKSTPGARDRAVATLASRQLRLITSSQLQRTGVSRNAIHNAARRGRLHRIHHGVYVTHPPPFSRNQRWLAAVLACGSEAALSHEPAAMLQGFLDAGSLIPHVTVSGGRGRSRSGIVVHRGAVDPRDYRRVDSIPCTSADRVLIDLAPTRDEAELERLLVAAESLGLVKRGRLTALVEERRGHPGIARLASILALEPALARSDLEALFIPIWHLAGVP
ncbi:MAG TPA: type IV toxin-antitoxin system AbiEi family antitoxin domain-containing protein, partial [Solirubrobacterales bacterium]|nr:type IV toxin-antitoxin system AbiEi family antitoxin domain-containing protein [Solirubrobacterales bacterium]